MSPGQASQNTDHVTVTETGETPFAQAIVANGHHLKADEPVKFGGGDTGPTPYDLLLAGLGACTSMTIRMYASHKKWPLHKVSVSLRHEKIHAKDCRDCETKTGRIDRIERNIYIEGDLTGEQRQRLLEIASRCPVHQTLQSEVDIETRLADKGQ